MYLPTNWHNKVMHVGITNNLERSVCEDKLVKGFTQIRNVNELLCLEEAADTDAAMARGEESRKCRHEKKNNCDVGPRPPRLLDCVRSAAIIAVTLEPRHLQRTTTVESVLGSGTRKTRGVLT